MLRNGILQDTYGMLSFFEAHWITYRWENVTLFSEIVTCNILTSSRKGQSHF